MVCTLINDSFGILVQLFLLIAAVSTLVYKRHREKPQRPWIIWIFDSSKQAFAGSLQHAVNMILGLFFGSINGKASQCIWYIVNFAITCFCGLLIIYWIMKLYDYIVSRYNLTLFKSGEYGNPPRFKPWALQLAIWCVISCLEKFLTATLVILPLYHQLDEFAAWIESPIKDYPHVELVIVMVICPAILNSLFFWVCDNIIKKKKPRSDISPYQQL